MTHPCTKTELTQYLRSKICPWCGARLASHHERSEDGGILPVVYTCTECGRNPREALALPYPEPAGQRPRPEGEAMSTKKTEKAASKKSSGEKHEEAATGRVHTIAKPRTKPVTGAPKEKPVAVIVGGNGQTPGPAEVAATPAKPPKKTKGPATDPPTTVPDDGGEIVVFAFRLTRAERDELHAATGSAKASRFVKAIVLAGARADTKAVQELIDEVQAGRK